MILLELANTIIEECLFERMNAERATILDLKCADFDGVFFHLISDASNRSVVTISVKGSGAPACMQNGGEEMLREVYGNHVISPVSGFEASLQYDLAAIAPQQRRDTAHQIAMLKTHIFSAPIFKCCQSAASGGNISELIDIPFRDSEERVWVKQDGRDRVTVIFSIAFSNDDDAVIGKVFLQEFKKSIAGAPSVDYSLNRAPMELNSVSHLPRGQNTSYVTFVLFERNFRGAKMARCAQFISTFRNYLNYHITCAKSQLHNRMRKRVDILLKVLNRAKQTLQEEKKTASGRTFKRK